jgi:multiple sugar transport system permease protein
VIAYPVYYTVYLSFFSTPPSLAMADKIYVGLEQL